MKQCELCGRESEHGNVHIHWCPRLNPVQSAAIDAAVAKAVKERTLELVRKDKYWQSLYGYGFNEGLVKEYYPECFKEDS